MAGQVVVVTGMMIVGADRSADAVDDGQVMGLFGEQRQVFAQLHACRGSADRLEWSSILVGRIRLEIPHIDMGRAAAEEKQDRRFRATAGQAVGCRRRDRGCTKRITERHTGNAASGRHQKRAA